MSGIPILLAVGMLAVGPSAQDGPEDRTADPTARQLDARRLRAAFLDLYGRPPFRAEVGEWRGREMAVLLDEALSSEAFWENWLEEELYYFLLVDNFRPQSERVLSIPADLAAGRIDVREALLRIGLCASFDRRNPGPDTFVTVVMEQMLGTTVQKRPRELEIAKRIYDGTTGSFLGETGSSQADVVRIAVEDREAVRHFLSREHLRLLREEAAPRDLASWTRALDRGDTTYPELLRAWFLSEAYERRLGRSDPEPNRIFVRSLYVDLLDRVPEEEDAQRIRNALDGLTDAGPLRSVVARLLIDSGQAPIPKREEIEDPTIWVAGLFERFLGREASTEELAAFVGAFHDPDCKPATVVYAIVSHPEYQTW